MFRSLGSAFCVVVMAAFVFGCGGGGGGTTPMDPPVVAPVPPADEPTDAERIAEAKEAVATILSSARAQAAAANSGASAIRANTDATSTDETNANTHNAAAQAALARIVSANSAAQAATTLAAVQTAQADARTAQTALNTAVQSITSIQTALRALADARTRRQMDEMALTNNSSLIQHVRDNKLLSDAVLGDAGANLTTGDSFDNGSIRVGPVGSATTIATDKTETCTAPCATFPGNTGTGATRVIGQRTVMVQSLTSDSTTPPLSGTGRLPHGFDLKNAAGTTFVNAYTDIVKTRLNVRTRTATVDNDPDTPADERYANMDFEDTDYLLAGIWMTVGATLSDSRITAFAYGSQAIAATSNFCVGIENSGAATGGPTRTCAETAGLNSISGFVDDGKDFTATYRGNANGAYLAGSDTSYFTGDVTLNAEFKNPTGDGTDGSGSIEGAVTNIVAGGQRLDGDIELQKHTFTDAIGAYFGDDAVGVVDGKSFGGSWKGQFFGMRHKAKSVVTDRTVDPVTITTTYKADAPGSVAGTFYATQQSNPAGEAAFIGAFGAHR